MKQTDIHFLSYLGQFFLEWEMFQAKVVEKIKTRISCSITPPPRPEKSCRLWGNVEKFCTAGQATDDNICPVRCCAGGHIEGTPAFETLYILVYQVYSWQDTQQR
jgi:hypothetical protein